MRTADAWRYKCELQYMETDLGIRSWASTAAGQDEQLWLLLRSIPCGLGITELSGIEEQSSAACELFKTAETEISQGSVHLSLQR